jgi:hypothetical protein
MHASDPVENLKVLSGHRDSSGTMLFVAGQRAQERTYKRKPPNLVTPFMSTNTSFHSYFLIIE